MTRTLVAGVGNVLLGDDGFGVAVARRLAAGPPPPSGVTVADYGIAGTHLAFDAADGYDELLLLDAVPPWPATDAGKAAEPGGGARPAGPGKTRLARPGELRLLEVPAPAAAAGTATPGHPEEAAAPDGSVMAVGIPAAPCDAAPVGASGAPGGAGTPGGAGAPGDGHAMTPDAVLRLLALLGGGPRRVLLLGCVPARVTEGIGLSAPVAAAVEPAAALVLAVLAERIGPGLGTDAALLAGPVADPPAGPHLRPRDGRPPEGRGHP